ncbi:MAG: CBS domain-containing protein [Methanomassiliicoccales archaeon]
MVEDDVGSVLVIDKGGRLVGMFTERDSLRHYFDSRSKFLYQSVDQVMTSPVLTITPDMPLEEGLPLLAQRKIHHLYV